MNEQNCSFHKFYKVIAMEMMKIENDQKYVRAKKKMEMLKAFYIHLTVYIFVNTLLLAINLLTDPTVWWFFYPLGG